MASRYILRAMKTSPRFSGVSGGRGLGVVGLAAAVCEISCSGDGPLSCAQTDPRHAAKRTARLRVETIRPPFASYLNTSTRRRNSPFFGFGLSGFGASAGGALATTAGGGVTARWAFSSGGGGSTRGAPAFAAPPDPLPESSHPATCVTL